ncbi:TVP38/TMEM64 family protein [Rufibacter quisquiliarum]|uniref:TVP38/TMEM64 family membrane protein n=1 Tax=Rufibacter quisquiliarum TaxID=1549639 RepID=A0A839GJV9_9BACT|nr:VTT domain-containing protein [Rufibacter quisquiliarum]MBA9075326.1 putative membrane protein YdjX (TVP38/TMEM64 family) [Rufibacter quisquiliarum]
MWKKLLQQNSGTLIYSLLLVVVPVVVSSGLGFWLYRNQELMHSLTPEQMLLYYLLISLTMAFALTPTTFVALATGFFVGWEGFPGVVIAYGAAALIGYQMARLIDQGKLERLLHQFPKAEGIRDELRSQSWSLIILTRISPVLPFAFMTFVLSLVRVPRMRFLVASMVGMLPRTLFFFWVGTQAQDLLALLQNPNAGTSGKLLMGGLVVISFGGLYVLLNRAFKKALAKSA